MAYKKVSDDKYKATAKMIERLKEFKKSFSFTDDVSLAKLEEANEAREAARVDKNATIDVLEAKTNTYNAADDKVEWVEAKLRLHEGIATDNESDAFVALGGTRQSELTARQQQTREENKKAAEAQKKAEGEKDAPK